MFNFFICLIISVFLSFGMSVAIVEKGKEWPIKKYRILLQQFIHNHIYWKFAQVLWCTTCTSFYMSLFSDIILFIIAYINGFFYFFWPFSGFITVGWSWFIIQFLNSKEDIVIKTDNNI
jgi:hypothetical protein